jgi:hypothetical protein
MNEINGELDKSMTAVLSPDQLSAYKKATSKGG